MRIYHVGHPAAATISGQYIGCGFRGVAVEILWGHDVVDNIRPPGAANVVQGQYPVPEVRVIRGVGVNVTGVRSAECKSNTAEHGGFLRIAPEYYIAQYTVVIWCIPA